MTKLETVPCPLCNFEGDHLPLKVPQPTQDIVNIYSELFDGQTISDWKACGRCGFVHMNPRPTQAAMDQFYLNAEYHSNLGVKIPSDNEDYLNFARWYFGDKVSYAINSMPNGKSVFEIGYGLGGSLHCFKERGWETYGIEPDKIHYDFAKNKLGLDGLQHGLLDETIEVPEKVDLIYSNHAFEHFTDLHGVVKAIKKILKPGGLVVTAVPTYMDNRSGLSLKSMNYAHLSCFNHNSLNQLFAYHGFAHVNHTYRGWWKEIDDIWHVAKFTGEEIDPKNYYESPQQVQNYINVVNPIRTVLFSPAYSNYPSRVKKINRLKYFVTEPHNAYRGLKKRISRRLGKNLD